MNELLCNLILVALLSSPKWSVEYFDAFCDRIEPLIHLEEIDQDELDSIMKEFDLKPNVAGENLKPKEAGEDLVDTGTKYCFECLECFNSAVQRPQ